MHSDGAVELKVLRLTSAITFPCTKAYDVFSH